MTTIPDGDTFLSMIAWPNGTSALGSSVGMPMRAAVDYTETWTPRGTVEARTTWTGKTILLTPTFPRMWDIELSGHGPAVWNMPAFDRLQPGAIVSLLSRKRMTSQIYAGSDRVDLSLPPIATSIKVYNQGTKAAIAYSRLHRRIILSGGNYGDYVNPCLVEFRPAIVCLVGETSWDAEAAEGTGTWRVMLHQRQAYDPNSFEI